MSAPASEAEPVRVEHVSQHHGRGPTQRQVLFDVSLSIRQGEVAILSGPSGSRATA